MKRRVFTTDDTEGTEKRIEEFFLNNLPSVFVLFIYVNFLNHGNPVNPVNPAQECLTTDDTGDTDKRRISSSLCHYLVFVATDYANKKKKRIIELYE